MKHSQAKAAGLRIVIQPDSAIIVISDDGHGFAVEPDNALADGLRNMRQRMSDIDGRCQIVSQPGGGTEVSLEFPLH